MNRRQRGLLVNLISVLVMTLVFVAVVIFVKDLTNRNEATKDMRTISALVQDYRKEHGFCPPESWLNSVLDQIEPAPVRLGQLEYRARYVTFRSPPDTILAYTYKDYHMFVGDGAVVMRLDGTVEWLEADVFRQVLARQQSEAEIEIMQQRNNSAQ